MGTSLKVVTNSMGEIFGNFHILKGENQHKQVEILRIMRFGLFWQNRETHYLWGRVDRYASKIVNLEKPRYL